MTEDTSPENLRKLLKNLFPSLEIDWDAAENDYEYSYLLAGQIATKSCEVAKRLGDIGDKRAVKPLIRLLNGKIEQHIYSIVSEIDDEFNEDLCGSCTACIDACPTHALGEYTMDSSKCISYQSYNYEDKNYYLEKSKLRNKVRESMNYNKKYKDFGDKWPNTWL